MADIPRYDVVIWQVHQTEDDCDIVVRTNNGRAFYCRISPSQFHQSPRIAEQYAKCLELLRSGEEEKDDFYVEDACDWLSEPFRPLIAQLAPSSMVLPGNGRPTLSQYLFPPHFVCTVNATNETLQAYRLDTQKHGWSDPAVTLDDEFLRDLDRWTRSYHPSNVEICYDRTEDVLIRRPTKVIVHDQDSGPATCFFKPFQLSFGPSHAKEELTTCKKITMAQIPLPAEAWICRLHGVVRDGTGLFGMLFDWIDVKGVLSKVRAAQSSAELRARWKAQIGKSLGELHQRGIIWGDAKAENVLIDRNDNAWIIDFGGSYTVGWVDEEKAGTLEGDEQGLERIMDILR